MLEIKKIKTENKALALENRELKQQIKIIQYTIEEQITKTIEKATTPLKQQIQQLQTQLQQQNHINQLQEQEIQRLKTQLNKNSTNSQKPPSTNNGYKKIIHNNREKTTRKTGAQKGHQGKTLTIPKNLNDLVKNGKAKKHLIDLTNGAQKYISKWTIDIEIITVYTEYRHPLPNMPSISYGENIKALTVLLSNNGLIAEGRLSNFFQEISNDLITLSDATIEKFNYQAAQSINIDEIQQDLLNGEVLNVDETTVRCVERLEYGQLTPLVAVNSSFNVVVRTHSSVTATLYTVNPYKDDEGVCRDGIVPEFCGILSHDHDRKYYKYGVLHATCGAHLSRELKGLFELYGIGWADVFRRFFLGVNEYKEKSFICDPGVLVEFERVYDLLVCEGELVLEGMGFRCCGFRELRAVLKRLRLFKDSYLLFIRDYRAPFTNNLAERDLRHCKTKQKVSGCFRSWRGLVCYARIRSFLSTTTKRGQQLFPAVKTLFHKKPISC